MTLLIAFLIGFALGLPVSAAIVLWLLYGRANQLSLATKNGDR